MDSSRVEQQELRTLPDLPREEPNTPPTTRRVWVIAVVSGVVVSCLIIVLLTMAIHPDTHHTTLMSSDGSSLLDDNPHQDVIHISENVVLTPRIIRALLLVTLAIIILTTLSTIAYFVLSAPVTVHVEPEPVREELVAEEVSIVGRVYKWCQDVMPERVDFAASLCCGGLLAILIQAVYPFGTNKVTTAVLLSAIVVLSVASALFLPPVFLTVSILMVMLMLILKWYTSESIAGSIVSTSTTQFTKIVNFLKSSPHLLNAAACLLVAVYAVVTWQVLDASGEGTLERWAMGPMLAVAVMAGLGQAMLRRTRHPVLEYVYLVIGLAASLWVSWLFDTAVIVEAVCVVLVWLFCRHFSI